jgi:hypothetical protein
MIRVTAVALLADQEICDAVAAALVRVARRTAAVARNVVAVVANLGWLDDSVAADRDDATTRDAGASAQPDRARVAICQAGAGVALFQ